MRGPKEGSHSGHGSLGRQGHPHPHGVGVQDSQARKDMLEACRESRHAGKLVEKLAENLAVQVSFYLIRGDLFLSQKRLLSYQCLSDHLFVCLPVVVFQLIVK